MSASSQSAVPSPAREACARAAHMIRTGAARREVLTMLVGVAEGVSGPGTVGSILLLDENGLLRNGASPNLPADYLDAIDRLKPAPNLGTCAAAAATGEIVVTPDFCADEKWAELRQLPMGLGFVGAWSMPIKAADGTVMGTFGTYFRERRGPTATERDTVALLVQAAAEAIRACR